MAYEETYYGEKITKATEPESWFTELSSSGYGWVWMEEFLEHGWREMDTV